MNSEQFQSRRCAVISPDDTFITAGGGVAEGLLAKAGPQFILNEVAKFSPIPHGTVAVTSAGNLPVHYIFHAAAIKVEQDASYLVSKESVYNAMMASLEHVETLNVDALWVPLMGTGAGELEPIESLNGILEAIRDWQFINIMPIIIMIFVYKFTILEKYTIQNSIQEILGAQFVL